MSGNGNSRGFASRFKNLFGDYRKHKDPRRNLKEGEEERTFTRRVFNLFRGYRGRKTINQVSTGNATRNNRSGKNNTRPRNSGNNGNNSNGNNNISSRNNAIVERVVDALENNETIELSQYEYDVIKAYEPGLEKEFTEKRKSNGRQYGSSPSTWIYESKK
jgi:hypothetical protein